jgi:hypothetical protein
VTEYLWSQTALTNQTSDPTVNWQEGQAPSTVNDSARAMMAALAKKRDDDGGLLVTGGTSTAYTLTSNQNLGAASSPANVNGFKITFQPNVANGAGATLSVDSQTAAPLYMNGTTALPAGYFQINGIYTAVYEASIPAWIVHNVFVPPIAIGSAQAAGTANAQTVTAPGFSLTAGSGVIWLPGYANTGALTLAVNGGSAKNVYIQTANGPIACIGGEVTSSQYAICVYDGTQFELIDPSPRPGFGPQATLASASTTDLGTIYSHNISITGTTTITSFGSSANSAAPVYLVTFAASLLLTYNATSLILPGAANIQTQAGDYCLAQYLGSGNWQVLEYVRAAIPLTMSMPAVQGLVVKNDGTTPNSKIDVSCTSAILTVGGIAGAAFNIGSQSLVINLGTTGANALDTGTVAASTFYFIYIIYNPATNTVAGLASLSSTAPTLPSGYTHYMRVGAMQTDGSSNLRRTYQKGKRLSFTSSPPATGTGTVTIATYVPSTYESFYMTVSTTSSNTYANITDSNGLNVGQVIDSTTGSPVTMSNIANSGGTTITTATGGTAAFTVEGWVDSVNAV